VSINKAFFSNLSFLNLELSVFRTPIRKNIIFMNKNKLLSLKSRYLFAILLAASISLTVQAQQGLIVKSNSGTTTSLSYSNVAKLTFVNEVMTAVSSTGAIGDSFVLATTKGFTFGNVAPNGLNNPMTGKTDTKLYPTQVTSNLYLKGATEGAQASIFSITGSKVMQFDVQSNLETIHVASLKKGIYMLRVSGQTFKFNKQ
jgi:hypothetical protein